MRKHEIVMEIQAAHGRLMELGTDPANQRRAEIVRRRLLRLRTELRQIMER